MTPTRLSPTTHPRQLSDDPIYFVGCFGRYEPTQDVIALCPPLTCTLAPSPDPVRLSAAEPLSALFIAHTDTLPNAPHQLNPSCPLLPCPQPTSPTDTLPFDPYLRLNTFLPLCPSCSSPPIPLSYPLLHVTLTQLVVQLLPHFSALFNQYRSSTG